MSLLSDLKAILDRMEIPCGTVAFPAIPPDEYVLLEPEDDDPDLFCDDEPTAVVESVTISIRTKGNYKALVRRIRRQIIKSGITVVSGGYAEFEENTGYHIYEIDTEQYYELED